MGLLVTSLALPCASSHDHDDSPGLRGFLLRHLRCRAPLVMIMMTAQVYGSYTSLALPCGSNNDHDDSPGLWAS